jgi:hypothetical protein
MNMTYDLVSGKKTSVDTPIVKRLEILKTSKPKRLNMIAKIG